MNQPTIKVIALVREEWTLAYIMIRINEIEQRISRQDMIHESLKTKVLFAHKRVDSYSALCEAFTDKERERMREYNINYCNNLSLAVENTEGEIDHFLQGDGPIYLYYLATRIQLQFSTTN